MGLFDKLKSSSGLHSPKSAMILAAITMIAIDGEVDEAEVDILRRLARGDDQAFDAAVKFWKSNDLDACIAASAARLTMPQRSATLVNLIDIAMADGDLAGAERALLEAYVEAFAISEVAVAQMVEVIAMKNDEDVFG